MGNSELKKLSDIRMRDPFVFVDQKSRTYYLYGTTDENPWSGKGTGFQYYTSKDLQLWSGPCEAFVPQDDFWGKENFWAPEVWQYQNSYIMFATFYDPDRCRGVQVLKTRNLQEPFEPIINCAVTPPQWECLDGTFYMDHERRPWLIFSHEWTQIRDGAICCGRLSEGLDCFCEEPVVLFHASEAPWTVPIKDQYGGDNNYITDGPFLFQDKEGNLKMIWSSCGKEGYAVGCSQSASGKITGPWVHEAEPVYKKNGGHAMIFESFEGKSYMVLHCPNETPDERPVFIKI